MLWVFLLLHLLCRLMCVVRFNCNRPLSNTLRFVCIAFLFRCSYQKWKARRTRDHVPPPRSLHLALRAPNVHWPRTSQSPQTMRRDIGRCHQSHLFNILCFTSLVSNTNLPNWSHLNIPRAFQSLTTANRLLFSSWLYESKVRQLLVRRGRRDS